MKRILRYILPILLLLMSSLNTSAQMMAVKTDLLKDALMIGDIGIDFVVAERHTIGMEFVYTDNPIGRPMKISGLMPEYRYWFNGRPFTRQHIGLVGGFASYDIMLGTNIYKGDAYGLGISFGHTFTLTPHWNIELGSSVGIVGYKQEFYYKGDNYLGYKYRTNSHGYYLMPIKMGVSVVYVIR